MFSPLVYALRISSIVRRNVDTFLSIVQNEKASWLMSFLKTSILFSAKRICERFANIEKKIKQKLKRRTNTRFVFLMLFFRDGVFSCVIQNFFMMFICIKGKMAIIILEVLTIRFGKDT